MEKLELNITRESAGPCVVQLTVEIPAEQVQREMQRTAKKIARGTNIPGFRKGKAPYRIILQRYGEETILHETAENLVDRVYREVLEREELIPYAPGDLVEMELEPMRFVFTVPLAPVVELGDYRSLRLKPPSVRVMKKEVAEILDYLREENAVLDPAEGRGARAGDMLVIDVEGRAEDGSVFMKDSEVEVVLDPDEEYPAPGFFRALEGIKVDEERTFWLDMPEGRSPQRAEFTVRLVELFDRTLPELDDDLARTVGNFDSLKELKKDIKAQLRQHKQEEADTEFADKVIKAVVAQATIEYPPEALEEELDDVVEQFGQQVRRERQMSLADYLKVTRQTEEELREELRPAAKRRLEHSLVLAQVVSQEGLEVSEEEIAQRITEIVAAWEDRSDIVREVLEREENRRRIANDLLVDKVVDRLVAIARGEQVEEG